MTKYIVLEEIDEEDISLIGFADNYAQANALAATRFIEAESDIVSGSNKNTVIEKSEIKVFKMHNPGDIKLVHFLDVCTTIENNALARYTLVKKIYLVAYGEEVKTVTSSKIIVNGSPEFQLDMFTYMEGGYDNGNSNQSKT